MSGLRAKKKEQTAPERSLYARPSDHVGADMKRRRRSMLPRGDINVTPFIDILLVLLVIFMTITPLTPTGLKAAVPQEPPPGPSRQESQKVIVLSMDRNGVIKINQNEIEPSQLIARLQ